MRRLALVCMLVLLIASPAVAAPSVALVQDIDASEYPVINLDVVLPAELSESQTNPVFSVHENGKSVEVLDAHGEQRQQAVDVVLLLDTSGSMKGAAITAAKQAAKAFIGELEAPSRVSVIAFADKAGTIVPAGADSDEVVAAIEGLKADGETALYDALLLATRTIQVSDDYAPVIVVLSDGGDTVSRVRLDAVLSELKRIEVPVVSVALNTPEADYTTLKTLSLQTGGRTAAVTDSAQLAKVYEGIARELQTRYRVAYRSRRPSTADLEIRVDAVAGDRAAVAEVAMRNPDAKTAEPVTSPLKPIPPASLLTLTGAVTAIFASIALLVFAVGLIAARPGTTMDQLRFYEQLHSGDVVDEQGRAGDKVSSAVVGAVDYVAGKRGLKRLVFERLERAGLPLRPAEYMTLHITFVIVLGVLTQLIGDRLLISIAAVVLATILPMLWLQHRIDKRLERFEEQLPDVLNLLSGSLRAGWGLQQSIDVVVQQANPPVNEEFRRVQTEVRLGRSVSEALESVADRVNSPDFDWIVSAIVIQRETGGNLAELLDIVAATIRERAALKRHIGALTAEGRLSGIILLGLPFIELGLLSLVNPGYMSRMYTTTPGMVLGSGAIALLIVGAIWLRKVIKVEV